MQSNDVNYQRKIVLDSYKILGSEPEEQFDNLTKLASSICAMPISLIGFMDEHKLWFKSKVGVEIETLDRTLAMCENTLQFNEFYEIEDLATHNQFFEHPWVKDEPKIRYYAGFPLKTNDNVSIGTICVIDTKPNKLTREQKFELEMIAKECVLQIELRKQKLELDIALEEANDLYNNAPCGYHSIDSEGCIIKINDTELSWLGYERSEVLGKKFLSFILAEEQSNLQDQLHHLREKGFIKELVVTLVDKQGGLKPISISSSAIYNNYGDFVRSRSICYDISEQIKIQKELNEANDKLRLANERLAALDEEKNTFLGMAAHDLKNPIMAISTLVGLVQKEKDLSPAVIEYLSYIEQSSKRMRTLISDLLDITRIELGSFEVELAEYDLSDLILETISIYKSAAQKKNITIDFNETSILFKTDRMVFVQIIDNLLSNAIKFSSSNKRIKLGIKDSLDSISIFVQDQGPGIKKEELGLLFQKFKRLSNKPTAGESTTGLGLSIAKEYCEKLKGTILCESEVGVGTTFTVVIPKL